MLKNRAKRILFIRNSCNFMSHSQMSYGMGVVATITHNAGYNVKVIDNNTLYKHYRDKDFFNIINSFKPDVLAYCISLYNVYETYQQIKKFKELFPNMIIIAGGVHMKHCFEEALLHDVDVVVNREGEKVILPLLEHLGNQGKKYKKGLESVPGVSFIRENGRFHFAKEFPSLENLDDVPIVNYELFNISDFIKTKSPEPGVFSIAGQRGCLFNCTFCSDEIQRADKRISSADWLFKNVANLYNKYNVSYLFIDDNNLALSRERLVDFCNKMIESGLNKKIKFSCQTTTRFPIDEELVCLMKKAGFDRINLGVERLTPYSLKKINKVQPLENIHKILSLIAKHGIDPEVFMMFGFPFETKELLDQEKKLFLSLTKYTKKLFLFLLSPAPGTIYYDDEPKNKEWYLDKKRYLMLRAYFTNVLDTEVLYVIKKNSFGFSKEIQQFMIDYYSIFKKIRLGSVFTKKGIIRSLFFKLDYCVAKISQAVFALSPPLEFFMFDKLKVIRHHLGNYFFSRNMLGNKN